MNQRTLTGDLPTSAFDRLVRSSKDVIRATVGWLAPDLARRLTNFHHLDDRVFLEEVILPFFRNDKEIRSVLWVGADWYTKPYEKFFRGKEYWTLEIDPSKKRFGSKRHVIAPLSRLEEFAGGPTFDAILCNGVFYPGGIDTREEAEASLLACFRTLKPGGWLVLGLDEAREFKPLFPPAETEALGKFTPTIFPPIGQAKHSTDTEYRHVYEFYRRSAEA